MESKTYRIREFIDPRDNHSLVVDTSRGLIFGVLPGLEKFVEALAPVLPVADGVVASPGQSRRLQGRTHRDAALLVRASWTNALRDEDFVLPPEATEYLPMINPDDGLDLGASAMVIDFLLGFSEEIDAKCVEFTVQMALMGNTVGMPLLVDVQAIGPRVVLHNKAIELGVSYALEGGADGVVVTWPGGDSFMNIQKMAAGVPVWVRPARLMPEDVQLTEALELGAAGFWLDEWIFNTGNPLGLMQAYQARLHAQQAEPGQEV